MYKQTFSSRPHVTSTGTIVPFRRWVSIISARGPLRALSSRSKSPADKCWYPNFCIQKQSEQINWHGKYRSLSESKSHIFVFYCQNWRGCPCPDSFNLRCGLKNLRLLMLPWWKNKTILLLIHSLTRVLINQCFMVLLQTRYECFCPSQRREFWKMQAYFILN